MAHAILDGMYAGTESAWHRLGIVDPTIVRSLDAINRGGMDYTIYKMPLQAISQDGIIIPFDTFGIVCGPTIKDNNYATLGTCGADYDFWQNTEIADRIDMLGDQTGWQFSTAGVLGKGETLFICLSVKSYSVRGDEVARYFVYNETRNGGTQSMALMSDTRVVCRNTLNLATRNATSKIGIRHHSGYKLESDWIMSMISEAERTGANLDTAMNQLAEITINDDQFSEMMDSVMPQPTMPRILTMKNLTGAMKEKQDRAEYAYNVSLNKTVTARNQMVANWVDAGDIPANLTGTGWHAYQSVTQYTSHQHGTLGSRGRKMSDASRAEWDLFGDGVQMRNAAYQYITDSL